MRICLPPFSEIEEGGVVGVVFIGFLGFHVTRQDDSDYDNDNSICLTQFRWLPFVYPSTSLTPSLSGQMMCNSAWDLCMRAQTKRQVKLICVGPETETKLGDKVNS